MLIRSLQSGRHTAWKCLVLSSLLVSTSLSMSRHAAVAWISPSASTRRTGGTTPSLGAVAGVAEFVEGVERTLGNPAAYTTQASSDWDVVSSVSTSIALVPSSDGAVVDAASTLDAVVFWSAGNIAGTALAVVLLAAYVVTQKFQALIDKYELEQSALRDKLFALEQKALRETKTELDSTQSTLGKVKTELDTTQLTLGKTKTELDTTQLTLGTTQNDVTTTQGELIRIQEELQTTKTILSETSGDLESLKEEQESLKILGGKMLRLSKSRLSSKLRSVGDGLRGRS